VMCRKAGSVGDRSRIPVMPCSVRYRKLDLSSEKKDVEFATWYSMSSDRRVGRRERMGRIVLAGAPLRRKCWRRGSRRKTETRAVGASEHLF
jgi:hypothetical protein